MNTTSYRRQTGWGTRLLIGLVLILAGAAAATWGLAHYEPAARFLGVAAAPQSITPRPIALTTAAPAQPAPQPPANAEIAALEARLARVENATQRAEGFAGRADALVVAFAARRAIDRGVALGYLEPLLVDRFGAQHQQAVSTIVTASHQPVRLNDLIGEYETLGPDLRRGGPQDSWWTNFRRELGSLIEVHPRQASCDQSRCALSAGAAKARRLVTSTRRSRRPCACPAPPTCSHWIAKARRYVAAHRALDELESAALLGAPALRKPGRILRKPNRAEASSTGLASDSHNAILWHGAHSRRSAVRC